MKTIIFGIGNPYRCDDSAGLRVIEELQLRIDDPDIIIRSGSIDGLTLLDEIHDFPRAVIVDSIKSKNGKPGEIKRIEITRGELPGVSFSHGIDFLRALHIGRDMGYKMPDKIIIYAIEITDNMSFNEECTEPVRNAIPAAVKLILDEVNR